jgi:hypothetical protein
LLASSASRVSDGLPMMDPSICAHRNPRPLRAENLFFMAAPILENRPEWSE